ncbi:hypothetical protein H5410_060575, partial [Solanum commersonii]
SPEQKEERDERRTLVAHHFSCCWSSSLVAGQSRLAGAAGCSFSPEEKRERGDGKGKRRETAPGLRRWPPGLEKKDGNERRGRYLEFEGKHGHYLAKKEQRQLKERRNEDLRIAEPVGESPIGLILAFCSSVLSPEGKDQIGDEKEQSVCR